MLNGGRYGKPQIGGQAVGGALAGSGKRGFLQYRMGNTAPMADAWYTMSPSATRLARCNVLIARWHKGHFFNAVICALCLQSSLFRL